MLNTSLTLSIVPVIITSSMITQFQLSGLYLYVEYMPQNNGGVATDFAYFPLSSVLGLPPVTERFPSPINIVSASLISGL